MYMLCMYANDLPSRFRYISISLATFRFINSFTTHHKENQKSSIKQNKNYRRALLKHCPGAILVYASYPLDALERRSSL